MATRKNSAHEVYTDTEINRIVGQRLFRDHVRILSSIEKRVGFAVVENLEISFGRYSGDAKLGVTTGNLPKGRIRSSRAEIGSSIRV